MLYKNYTYHIQSQHHQKLKTDDGTKKEKWKIFDATRIPHLGILYIEAIYIM